MITYGLDVSHYQDGLSLPSARRQGYRFAVAKLTQGTGYVDPSFGDFRHQAEAGGWLFAAYHFLEAGNGAGQAEHVARHIGDKTIPVFVDLEASRSRPTLADANAFRHRAHQLGLRVDVLYGPHWYWQQIGAPSLKGWRLWASSYPAGTRHAHGSTLYLAGGGRGWARYGGASPILWQFTGTGRIDGYAGNVDLDAFRGSRAALARTGLFKDYAAHAPHQPAHRSRGRAVDHIIATARTIKGGHVRQKVKAAILSAALRMPYV